ncbi:MAG: hypothetical protein ACO1TE_07600 [Prosthecobacter sp.]
MATVAQPVPKNLRELMLKRVSSMDEKALERLHDLDLLQEKMSLREEMSRQAEAEQTAGQWAGLADAVRAYRSRDRQS